MAGLGDIVQKALYLGVGLASYATEKAGVTLQELKTQAQKLADELVERGEMTAEEARKYVDELVQQAQQSPVAGESGTAHTQSEPRRIEIVDEEETGPSDREKVDHLRQQIESLQAELRNLKQS
jgi:polyhydroxyalkanoate synthesis regulator phasin